MREFSRTIAAAITPLCLSLAAGCGGEQAYDTSTPEAVVVSAQEMVRNGDASRLPELIHIDARDIQYEDGVTEASAIAEVKGKLSELLGRMWTVGETLQARFPEESIESLDEAVEMVNDATGGDWTDAVGRVLSDPFRFVEQSQERLEIIDLGDGTAAVLWDDEPALGGFVAMVEVDGGWKIGIPIELVRDTDYWPQTRWEWSVVASMLLSIENTLEDFERMVDGDRFKSLSQASAYAGRLLGESVIVQGVIYGFMKRDVDESA